ELADLPIVTSDNPRTEAPRAIIDAILPAVPRPFFVDVDRRVAIRAAVAEATPGDVVVIAGKGHEDYQILGTTKHHFDDREDAAVANGAVAVMIDSRGALARSDAARAETARDSAKTGESGRFSLATRAARVPAIVVDDTRLALGKIAKVHRQAWEGKLVAITG